MCGNEAAIVVVAAAARATRKELERMDAGAIILRVCRFERSTVERQEEENRAIRYAAPG